MKRNVYYIDETMVDEKTGQFVPAIVTENEPGYSPTTYLWGTDFAKAKKFVDEANTQLGIDRVTALKIVATSLAAQNRG